LPTSRSRTPETEREGGVTLLELLVVLSILGVLLGLGVGVYGTLVTPDTVAAGRIRDTLRGARLLAQREGLPASVVVDPASAQVYALGLRSAGNWHFEDDAGTGWPVPSGCAGCTRVPRGVIGSAVRLDRDSDLHVTGLPASADSPQGFGVDCWLQPDAEPRPMTLLERPGQWTLHLDDDGSLIVSIWLAAKPSPEELRRELPDVRLAADRFTRLTVVFDGHSLHVEADGRRCGEDTLLPAERLMASAPRAPIRTGEGLTAFRGALDELRLFTVSAEAHEPFTGDVRLLGAARVLHLDDFGRLDPAFHSGPEVVSFETGEPPVRTNVELGTMGSVRTWTDKP
jgi:prepilin-type N-terminal cleavage/methylation domain-containing protein